MTANDFNIGDTWRNSRGRRVEIVAADVVETENVPFDVHVFAYRFHGMSMIHIRATTDIEGWSREAE